MTKKEAKDIAELIAKYELESKQQVPVEIAELIEQGVYRARVYCERCDYVTDIMAKKDLYFKLCVEGGYIISDNDGGYFSRCPKCKYDELVLDELVLESW